MEISSAISTTIKKSENNYIYKISKKLILSEKESKVIDEEIEKILNNYDFRVGTNEVEFFVSLKKENKTEISSIKNEIEEDLINVVYKAKEKLEDFCEEANT